MEACLREKALSILQASLKGADPKLCVKRFLKFENGYISAGNFRKRLDQIKRIIVAGAGKASALMAQATEEILEDRIDQGIVIAKEGSGVPLEKIKLLFGGHPFPDENGAKGTQEILQMLSEADSNDLVIFLLSGGGSALLVSPVDGVSLKDKKRMVQLLIECGANIDEMNTIRKHISKVKGGRLAKIAYPAQSVSLILSDVIGDRLDSIASGPTAPDPTTFDDCFEILNRYKLFSKLPKSIKRFLGKNKDNQENETHKPGDMVFEKVENVIVGSNLLALEEAEKKAKKLGFNTLLLSSTVSGNTTEAAIEHASLAREIREGLKNPAPPVCLISGGETTVEIKGNGKGGRNQEFVLVSAIHIQGLKDVVISSMNTDGIDGPTDAAGAICDGTTVSRANKLNMNPKDYLKRNDSYYFFEKLGDLIKTGPTNTNVMDIHLILVG
ncbi:MAG: glycerate kinase [candidate division Zixibacteria bacterium]|nr:glycerate kinase [candidate division Zixibacteria bacterium]